MPPLEHAPILALDDLYRGRLTAGGRVLLWGTLATGLALLAARSTPMVLGFGFCASALLLAAIMGAFYRPRLSMARRITVYPTAGADFNYRVDVENVGKRTARHLVVEERGLPPELRPSGPSPVIAELAPGERVAVNLRLSCLRRGAYDLERLQGASTLPTGLLKSGRKVRQSDRLIVLPRVSLIEDFELPHGSNYQPGGIAVASSVGDSPEFLGTRDWRHGDRVRDIHWPSTARTGRLIAREFREEYFIRLAVVLDVEARSARGEQQLDRAISLTAGITAALSRKDYIVDIFAAGSDVYRFQAGRALASFENILEVLSCLESCRRMDTPALEAVLLPETPSLSAVILVMMEWDSERAQLVRHLKSRGVSVRIFMTRRESRPEGLLPDEFIEALE
jgi:uncharacterized protein (DUF58 family)